MRNIFFQLQTLNSYKFGSNQMTKLTFGYMTRLMTHFPIDRVILILLQPFAQFFLRYMRHDKIFQIIFKEQCIHFKKLTTLDYSEFPQNCPSILHVWIVLNSIQLEKRFLINRISRNKKI